MMAETMTVQERLQAAIALEPVDRHPVFPILVTAAPRLCGITQAEAWRNHEAAREAILRCHRDFGYDVGSKPNYYYPMLPGKLCAAPVRNLIPGKQLGEDDLYQVDERVLFRREDYDRIAALGWNRFWEEHYERMGGKRWERFVQMQGLSNALYKQDLAVCRQRGMEVLLGVAVDSVLMAFSLSRTLPEFTRDLFEVPDKVEAAMRACCDDLIANAVEVCRDNGNMLAFTVLERGSGFYYRLELFERFEWPFLQRYVDAFVAEGITPWLHLDTDWGLNLPHFRKLPRGKCVADLDGTTDIFRAKEILGGHMCISGDVPASLLSLGTPAEVGQYCRRLIDEVGEGGGFMLTTGCECPMDVRPENLRAMVETGKSHRGQKGRTREAAREAAGPGAPVAAVEVRGEIGAALAELRRDEFLRLVDEALDRGKDPLVVLEECRSGMEKVGALYSSGQYFLAELMLSAMVFKTAAERLQPLLLRGQGEHSLGGAVIATPKGDVHDIGKDMVATMLRAAGFQVYDLGVNVPPEAIAEKVAETGARIVAMSALLTTTFDAMKQTVDLLGQRGLREGRYVIIGGGPTTAKVKDHVGADAWTLNPQEGVNLCRAFTAPQP